MYWQLNEKCRWVSLILESIGLDSYILKEQGVTAHYPDHQLQQSDDIDVWTKTRVVNLSGDAKSGARDIIKRLKVVNSICGLRIALGSSPAIRVR